MSILCATDFSPPAMAAADVAAAIAKKMDLPLRLVHCTADWVPVGEFAVPLADDSPMREQLSHEAERLRKTGVKVVEDLLHGRAGPAVCGVAAGSGIRMLVVGSVAKGMFERLATGSVAELTAETAAAPVLIVRDARPLLAWLNEEAPLKVLCGVNFSPSADAALAFVGSLAALGGVDLAAACVSPSLDDPGHLEARTNLERDLRQRLDEVLGDGAGLGDAPARIILRGGTHGPARELMALAGEEDSGLVAVGVRPRSGWRRLLHAPLAHDLVMHARTNVLCVPASSHALVGRRPRITRVLAATDFSACGNEAVRQAASLLPQGGELRLLHVCLVRTPPVDIEMAMAADVLLGQDSMVEALRQEAETELHGLRSLLPASTGLVISTEVVAAHDCAKAVCAAADRFSADVICLGTTGHSRPHIALLGSTVQGVLAHAGRPVFAVTLPRS